MLWCQSPSVTEPQRDRGTAPAVDEVFLALGNSSSASRQAADTFSHRRRQTIYPFRGSRGVRGWGSAWHNPVGAFSERPRATAGRPYL